MNAEDKQPTISQVLADGALVELVFDPAVGATALAVAPPGEAPRIEPSYSLPGGGRLVPYSANNNLLTSGCVLLPSDIGDFGDKGDLIARIRAFLNRYVDLSPEFEEVAAYYVLLSWVYDRFNDLPYLRLRGAYGSGKTRALLALGSLCYKPFFASGASTVSPIFHIQDAFAGTLVLDEADFRFSDATADLTKILNNGTTRGLPVLRTMINRHRELNPTAFRVFGPKVVAMRETFSDQALESRFLTEDMTGRVVRADIPIHLPAAFAAEGLALRNALLAWRLRAFHSVAPRLDRVPGHLTPRAKQMALALLSLVDEAQAHERICAWLGREDTRSREAQAAQPEVLMVRALGAAFADATAAVPVAEVARRFNLLALEGFQVSMTNKWVGWFVRTRLRLATMKSGGVFVVPLTERPAVAALVARHGPLAQMAIPGTVCAAPAEAIMEGLPS